MGTEIPDYNGTDFPQMPTEWKSDTNFDLGWIANLYSVSNKTLSKIYGEYEFRLNPDDILDFSEFDSGTFVDSPGPVIYLALWTAILVFFAIVGICWCACANKCCCCCRSSFKGKGSVDEVEDRNQLRPYYSERNDNKSKGLSVTAIVISLLMAVWLAGFLIMILHAFASNDKTKESIDQIEPDLNNAVADVETYIVTTIRQLEYTFGTGFNKLNEKLTEIFDGCGSQCDLIKPRFEQAIAETNVDVQDFTRSLRVALDDVDSEMKESKNVLDEDYQKIINDVNNGIHWLFYLFNIIYCVIFGLVLVGTVLAGFGSTNGMKTIGFLMIRGGIVLMFIIGICVIIQLIAMFVIAGLAAEIFCPAIRDLENEPEVTALRTFKIGQVKQDEGNGNYQIPNFGQIIRACKNDDSAYDAFDLQQVLPLDKIKEIVENFDILGSTFKNGSNSASTRDSRVLSPEDTVKEIQEQVNAYVGYVTDSIKTDVGKTHGTYVIINATVSLFCDKITSPISSYWFILQFIPLTFILIFVTALFFERLAS